MRRNLDYWLWWSLGCDFREGPNLSCIVMYDCLRDWLFAQAMKNADAREILRDIVVSKLHAGVALSGPEAFFASSVLRRTMPPIRKKRGKKPNYERDVFIVTMMMELTEKFGVTASRNDAISEQTSACDMIADAFNACGRHEVTFRAVKDVWNNQHFRKKYQTLAEAINGGVSETLCI